MLYRKVASLKELPDVVKDIVNLLPSSAIVLLNGDLAAGKTTLVSNIVKELNGSKATSPTFSLQQVYKEGLYHYDFYRVELEEIIELGLLEELEKDGLHFVEWAREPLVEILKEAGFSIYKIDIKILANKREYKLEVVDA